MATRSSFLPSGHSVSEDRARLETPDDHLAKMGRIVNKSVERLERRLRSLRFTDLHFFPEFHPPDHFRLPNLDFYDGLGCPVSHVFTYTSDLVQAGASDQALIRLFYKTLQGPALQWLLTVDHSFSSLWADWASLFINRYHHNIGAGANSEYWRTHVHTSYCDFCFFPDFRLPKHFQVPKLDKYAGQGCPIAHLFVYCRDLRFLGADDEILISLFYKSLAGPALRWFLSQDRSFSEPWSYLSFQFVEQFREHINCGLGYGGALALEYATEFEKFWPYSEFRLPKTREVPEFQKYDGRGCPLTHLFVYREQLRQIGNDDYDEKFVSLFYRSLSGIALRWYVSVDHHYLSSWHCLAQLFVEQFRSHCDASAAARWNMIPFQDVIFLPDFKLPVGLNALEVEKYSGEGCPFTHLLAYCEDLRQLGASDEALLFLFYKSLTGPALTWFASIADCYTTWDFLVELFVDKYSFKLNVNAIQKWYEVGRLFPDFRLPNKFKVPRFEKYNGEGCPISHLFAYFQELRLQGVADEKVIMCLFYKSLTGPALTWCVSLDGWLQTSWENLSGLFIERYSCNIDLISRKKLRKMQAVAGYVDWCFFPEFRLPTDFKVPEFRKYSGYGCPIDHLCAYRRDLHGLGVDEEMLVCLFHKSLTGPAFIWFMNQDHCSLKSWGKLSALFSCSFCDSVLEDPKNTDLMNVRQRDDESFSDYVKRWRLLEAQIVDSRNLEEQIKMVKQSAHSDISGYLMLSQITDFQMLIRMGSVLETRIKNGVIKRGPSISRSTKENSDAKKEGEGEEKATTSKDSSPLLKVTCHSLPIVIEGTQARCPRRQKGFMPIGQSYGSVLELLLERGLLSPLQPSQLNPQSRSYDAHAHCAYHQGPGHSTENCFKLKHALQYLIDKGKIVIAPPTTSKNTSTNPKHKAKT